MNGISEISGVSGVSGNNRECTKTIDCVISEWTIRVSEYRSIGVSDIENLNVGVSEYRILECRSIRGLRI